MSEQKKTNCKRALFLIIMSAVFMIMMMPSVTSAKTGGYYSPKQLGMKKYDNFTGKNAICVRSIKDSKLIYSKSYRVEDENGTYLSHYKKKFKARLTKKTKYFIGNISKIAIGGKEHTSKWLKKVSKKAFMNEYLRVSSHSCYDKIIVEKGNVKAVAINCQYAG